MAPPLAFMLLAAASLVGVLAAGGSAAPPAEGQRRAGGGTQQGSGRAGGQQPSPSAHLDVTFISDVPETEIYLQDEKAGTTDKSGQLLVRLVPGDYRVRARKQNYISQQRTIKVGARQTSFKFFMGAPLPAATPAATPAPTPTPTPGGGDGDEAAAATVLERFRDPKLSGQVKQADWQSLLAATYQDLARDPNSAQLKAQAQFAQGQLDYLGGNYANAQHAFNAALRLVPGHALAAYGLGNTYLATNQAAQAVSQFESALRTDPKLGMAYKGLGDAWTALKKEKQALAAYARARELGFLSSEGSLGLARNLLKEKRWAEALSTLQALPAEQQTAEVYVLMGDSHTGLKKLLDAFHAYTEATKKDSSNAQAHYRIGEIQLRENNDPGAARDAFERALALDPQGTVIDRKRARQMADEAGEKLRKLTNRAPKPSGP